MWRALLLLAVMVSSAHAEDGPPANGSPGPSTPGASPAPSPPGTSPTPSPPDPSTPDAPAAPPTNDATSAPPAAAAPDGAGDLDFQLDVAREAARRGDCPLVVRTGRAVGRLDFDFYASTFIRDPAIAQCLSQAAGSSSNQSDMSTTPPISAGRIVGEMFVGTLGTIGGGAVGAVVGYVASEAGERGDLPFAIPLAAGAALGATVGVYAIGSISNQTGSFVAALGGAAVFSATGAALFVATGVDGPGLPILFYTPAIGAMIGFNLTRRYEDVQIAPVVSGNTVGIAGSF